ncbi:MAG: hypothetical protein N2578_08290, partial [Bdellovibrionaceae bacterium]|nr:hypothetical protein [Pseudobdellovibrionaceae bacterium]
PHWRFIICLSAPSILIFWPQPYFADYKPHWSGPAYLFLVMGAGQIWASGVTIFFRQILRPLSRWLTVGLLIFLVPINLFFYTSFIYPWLPKAYRALNPGKEWNTTWDLTNEFHGWKEVGEFVNRRQREIHASEGVRPFIAALRYETTAQTWWGTGQRTLQVSRDRSHYSVLQKKKEALENVKGLNALVLTTEKYPENPMDRAIFSSCEPEEFRHYRGDELSRIFTVWYCRDFQGVK